MTDLEMTKLCAESMGLRVFVDAYGALCIEQLDTLSADNESYDPLHDDVQAMALVKRLEPALYRFSGKWCAERNGEYSDSHDLNRAIVECVAKMQSGKK